MVDTTLPSYEIARRLRKHLYEIRNSRASYDIFSSEELAEQLKLPHSQILATLIKLREMGAATSHDVKGVTYWGADAPFIARKIVPLFAGTPEWIVESGSGELIGWFPREFLARITADALNRS